MKRKGNGSLSRSTRNELTDMFDIDNFFSVPAYDRGLMSTGRYSEMPAANIRENDTAFIIDLAAPGLDKKDFRIDIDNDTLVINVEKDNESREELVNYSMREYNYDSFSRSYSIPNTVNTDKISAEYRNGVLHIHLPKMPEAVRKPAKQIKIS